MNNSLKAFAIFSLTALCCCQVKRLNGENKIANEFEIDSTQLDKRAIENLALAGQIWGFLKYYHPAVVEGKYQWDDELLRILPETLKTESLLGRTKILNDWVGSLGDVIPVKKNEVDKAVVKIKPDLAWIDNSNLEDELIERLSNIKAAKRPENSHYISLEAGIGNPVFKNEKAYAGMDYPDARFRLLCLFRYWNMINYYFPYKNLIDEDWNKVLIEFIPKFVNAKNEREYKLVILSIIERIHDTHANIWGPIAWTYEYRGKMYAPLEIGFVEGKACVTGYQDNSLGKSTGLKMGDIIESINGKSVTEIVKEKLSLTPASNYPTKLRDIAKNLLRTNSSTLKITYFDGIKTQTKNIKTLIAQDSRLYAKYYKRDTCFKMINSKTAYIYAGSLKNEYLSKVMLEVQKAKGLIIDFRCYPSDFLVFSLSEYLLPKPKSFVKFSIGSVTIPGLFTFTSELKVGKDNPDYFKGKVVILVNETTQSSAEYHCMAFRTAPHSIIIGSTTSGADGNVSQITLPGGIETMISGIGVYYPDGTETQRIGIRPDIEVKPTLKGIKKGRDELMERAIQLLNDDKLLK